MTTPPATPPSLAERLLGPRDTRIYRVLGIALATIGVALVVAMWLHGREYYRLDPSVRVDHDSHKALRASGAIGHFYGIVGTLLILLNLLYFARKNVKALRGRGSLRAWMELHVFAGLIGSGMIVFHSAFQVRNQLAQVASWSLGVLVVTGLLGRYMYALLPRSRTGEEEDAASVATRVGRLRRELAGLIGDGDLARAVFARLAPRFGALSQVGPAAAILQLPLLPLERLKDARLHRAIATELRASLPDGEAAARLALDILRLEAQRRAAGVVKDLFLWWRALHRAFALVMVAAMLVHVGVAVYFGYRWLF